MKTNYSLFQPPPARLALLLPRLGAIGLGTAVMLSPHLTLCVAALIISVQAVMILICNMPVPAHRSASLRKLPDADCIIARLSVHVVARNEPPDVLISTLQALSCQTGAPDHEIVVVINNTPSEHLWQPVETWCYEAGPRFRFVRRDNVVGAKAGALNIALDHTDRRMTHVVVLDADYQVVPGFLGLVAQTLRRTDAAFIQFPQAYRHIVQDTEGLAFELAEYFNRHARAANLADAMLLTGTLSVIRREALVAVGGWPGRSCTEDAELGVTLIAAGYRGVFVDREVGRGLMPLDLANLHGQRKRWAAGNTRVLTGVLRNKCGGDGPWQCLLVVAQLAAWLNFGAVAVATLIIGAVQAQIAVWSGLPSAVPDVTVLLSVLTLFLILIATVWPILRTARPHRTIAVRFQALASRLSMAPVAACATLWGCQGKQQVFRITAKVPAMGVSSGLGTTLILTAALGISLVLVAALSRDPAIGAAALFLLLPPVGGLFILRPLSRYAAHVAEKEV